MKKVFPTVRCVVVVLLAATVLIARPTANLLAQSVASDKGKLADGRTVAAAYRALQQKNASLAERRFREVLAHSPGDGSALAGMGYIAMRRQDFVSALYWLKKAERHGQHNAGLRHAIAIARFWLQMNAAESALSHHQLQAAETSARKALAIQPRNPNATLLLARVLAADGRLPAAIVLDRQVAVADPASAEAWSGWLKTSTALHQPQPPLAAFDRLPPNAQAHLRQN
ncbi:MAG TPA: tetratricopeptide repeat protein, partial [Pirellulales bacterium]